MSFLFFATSAPLFAAATPEPTKEQAAFFESKVRPVLVDNCYKCHSLEQGKAKGKLTLDTREGLRQGGEDGEIVQPGDPDHSMLVTAIRYEDPDLQMPPKGEKLTPQQIADLTAWVKMGAPDPRKPLAATNSKLSGLTDKARSHWAFQPIKKPALPEVKNRAWARTPVDLFILKKLEEKSFLPMPDASKEALLRRATYDLTGLPPTPADVQSFLGDGSPEPFGKVVERLLASPAYGEKWGRHWLDSARYSDTTGSQQNQLRGTDYRYAYAWTYRDWVIKALNDDMPYDRFIEQQLAADQLPKNAPQNLAALGFLTVGERFPNVNDVINDRIDVVSKGFLGLTVACARCHDHMFDPIPTKDYYALHGIFSSTIEPAEKPVIATTSPAALADFQRQLAALEQEDRVAYYRFIDRTQGDFFKHAGGYLLASQFGARKKVSAAEQKARAEMFVKYGLNRDLFQAFARQVRRDDAVFAPFRLFSFLSREEFPDKAPALLAEIAGNRDKRHRLNSLVVAAFAHTEPESIEDIAAIYQRLFASLEPQRRAFLAASEKAGPTPVAGYTAELAQLLQLPLDVLPAPEVTTAKLRELTQAFGPQLTRGSGFLFAQLNELELTHPGAPARPMLVADAPRARDSAVLIRGQAETRGEVVPRRFLEILSPAHKPLPFQQGSGRLELAQSIASPANPLTARVLVNRVWMHHFGDGFVRTLDDLGTQSEAPSHPELLDWLAANFMENGWSLKKLHRLIMLSHVYQESTQANPNFAQQDPENRLLWRANIRRLDFEATRDSLLVFSGKMDATLGGKPVNLTEEPYSFRRSVYGYIDRGNLPELMQNFDFSDPDMPNSKRASSIVPQQALFLMNSAMSVDVARRIIARPEVAAAGDDLARVIAIYRIIFQRTPKPAEIQLAMSFVSTEAQGTSPAVSAKAHAQPARKRGGNPRLEAMRPIQNSGELIERKPLTAWETYAQALLFSNEASYVN